MKGKLKILIADDHAIVREGLASILGFQKDFQVVGEAANGIDAVNKAAQLAPDIVLMDLMMPQMDGAAATAEIIRIRPETRILLLTSYATSSELAIALQNGIVGAITKNAPKEELFAAIRRIAHGETSISPEINQTLDESQDAPTLTKRQREMLEAISRGLSNGDIAQLHGISIPAVKFHLLALFRKLEVANRTEAVALALRKRLLKQ